ncbi:MAG: glutathione S-transferase, partial [Gammaproteobacteria bacterium]|nr:glutathione S-transferase [Gammaproteobacteria bacterium]
MKETYRIIGVESSPYTVKVRAVMRFRRLPHVWLSRMPQYFEETLHVRPLLMPVVQFPDGTYRTDTTPIILDLERLHPNGRSIVPTDPAAAFLSLLIEDMADEWLSKCLFHNRFSKPENRSFAPAWVMDDAYPDLSCESLEELTAKFLERQTNR